MSADTTQFYQQPPADRRLIKQGLIAESDCRPAPDSDDERRRYYGVSELGRQVVVAETERMRAVVAAVSTESLTITDGDGEDGSVSKGQERLWAPSKVGVRTTALLLEILLVPLSEAAQARAFVFSMSPIVSKKRKGLLFTLSW